MEKLGAFGAKLQKSPTRIRANFIYCLNLADFGLKILKEDENFLICAIFSWCQIHWNFYCAIPKFLTNFPNS